MGFPTDYFTVLFALGRLPGWIAQWDEMLTDPEQKIARPKQVYTGPEQREFVPIADRLRLGRDDVVRVRVEELQGFGGVRLEQNVLIGGNGCEVLTAAIPLAPA